MNTTALLKACLFMAFCVLVLHQISFAQNRITVTGTVKDRLDKPIPGVSVSVRGAPGRGTTTKEDGSFSLEVTPRDVMVFTSVGYKELQQTVNNSITFDIVMDAVEGSQQEVVVVGFGRQRKISLVGAQSTVNVEELKIPVANISAALSGRIAGLVGVQRNGLPGSNSADVWIRGISTFNNVNPATPLIIVDGVQGRDLNAFDPEDIASFTVLKDASATAVYGVAGANGVIIITTKKGRSGKPSLMFNYNHGISAFTKRPELTDAETYMRLRNEAQVASGLPADYSQAYIDSTLKGNQPFRYPNVNWMETIFKDVATTRRANFSARGGSDNANYYVSLAYFDEQSLLKTDVAQRYNADTRFRRYNFTSNVNMNWTKSTRFELGVQGYITNTNYPGVSPQDAFGAVMQATPILYPVMYPGNLVPALNAANAQRSPYEMITQTGYVNIAGNQVYTNARIQQDLSSVVKGLSVYALYSFDVYNSQITRRTRQRITYRINQVNPYNADGTLNLIAVNSNGTDNLNFSNSNSGNRRYYLETAINYDHELGKRGRITGLLLYNRSQFVDAFAFGTINPNSTSNVPSNNVIFNNPNQATNLTNALPYKSQGVAGRVTYSWGDKYFAEANFGYNGSENFAPANRYGFFPSFGVGWVVSNEKFFAPLQGTLQFLKIRYSDGLVGSGSGGRRFGYLTLVSDQAAGYIWGNGLNNLSSGPNAPGNGGVSITDIGTPVQWSTSRKQDLGVEIKTFNNKLSLIVDFFKEHRTGVFLQRSSLPNFVGLNNNPWGNLGEITNQGIDGTIEVAPFNVGATSWTLRGTATYNRDKVIENDNPVQPYPYMERRGFNLVSTYGYTAMGLFADQKEIDNAPDQTPLGGNPRPGDIRYKDLNGDGLINQYDVSRIGNGDVPTLTYGFGFNVTWKQWYFGAFFQGIGGAERQLSGDGIIPFNNSTGPERSNLFTVAKDRWTPENPNPNAFYPRLAYGNAANRNNAVTSTWWQKDIDFIRLKTLDFGYNFKPGSLQRLAIKNARIYVQGLNLLYWSSFKLWDPELNTANGSLYPLTRLLTIGAQVNF